MNLKQGSVGLLSRSQSQDWPWSHHGPDKGTEQTQFLVLVEEKSNGISVSVLGLSLVPVLIWGLMKIIFRPGSSKCDWWCFGVCLILNSGPEKDNFPVSVSNMGMDIFKSQSIPQTRLFYVKYRSQSHMTKPGPAEPCTKFCQQSPRAGHTLLPAHLIQHI